MIRSPFRTVTAGVALVLIALGVVLLGPTSFGPRTTGAAGFTVNSTADASDASPGNGVCATAGGACTLRAAIQEANALPGADGITVPAGTYNLSAGQLTVSSGLTLNGAGQASTIIDGGALDLVLETSGTVEISGLTIRNGADSVDYHAGGIENLGTLTLNDSIVSGNSSSGDYGTGGIKNKGTLTLNGSTVSGNSATGYSGTGGIENPSFRTLTLNNSSVSGNIATVGYGAGGIQNYQWANATLNNSTVSGNAGDGDYGTGGIESFQWATMTLNNSTVSGNSAAGAYGTGGIQTFQSAVLALNNSTVTGNSAVGSNGADGIEHYQSAITILKNTIIANNGASNCNGPVISGGHNLDGDGTCGLAGSGDVSNVNPLLGPLADNGGPTLTHALLSGSPAIDAGSGDCPPPATDQRGAARPFDGDGDSTATCDIGAYETCVACPLPTVPPTPNQPTPLPTVTHTPTSTHTPTWTLTPTPTPCGPGGCPTPTATPTPVGVFIVNSTADVSDASPGNGVCATSGGACTLRAAIQEANALAGADVITVPAGTYVGQFTVTTDLILNGAGAATTIVDGAAEGTVFWFATGTVVQVSDLTVQNGSSPNSAAGIYNGGELTLNRVTVRDNRAYNASGGIHNSGEMTLNYSTVKDNSVGNASAGVGNGGTGVLTISHSTISGNHADNAGGGIGNSTGGVLTITSSTISGNSVGNSAGGVSNAGKMHLSDSTVSDNTRGGVSNQSSGLLTVNNSTIADGIRGSGATNLKNTIVANNAGSACANPVTSFGHNLSDDNSCGLTGAGDISNTNPQLGPLADNGGPTLTHALLPGSPAIDAGSGVCPPPETDQRGVLRIAPCDIGAFEWGSNPTATPTPTPCGGPCPTPTVTPTPDLTDTDGDGCTNQQENGPDEMLGGMRDWQNPDDYYDVAGSGGGPPDQIIDLSNDIFGVIIHYAPTGNEAEYDVGFDRGPSTGPDAWNMTAPDGVIDLSNDIMGVIQQYQHDCS